MRTTLTAIAVPTTVRTIDGLSACVEATIGATERGDTAGAKKGLGALQAYLLNLNDKARFANEAEILRSLSLFPHRRGSRITNWLLIHSSDNWSRAFWGAVEDILTAPVRA